MLRAGGFGIRIVMPKDLRMKARYGWQREAKGKGVTGLVSGAGES